MSTYGRVRTDGDGALDGLREQQRRRACAQRKAGPLLAGVDQADTLRASKTRVSQGCDCVRLQLKAALVLTPASC